MGCLWSSQRDWVLRWPLLAAKDTVMGNYSYSSNRTTDFLCSWRRCSQDPGISDNQEGSRRYRLSFSPFAWDSLECFRMWYIIFSFESSGTGIACLIQSDQFWRRSTKISSVKCNKSRLYSNQLGSGRRGSFIRDGFLHAHFFCGSRNWVSCEDQMSTRLHLYCRLTKGLKKTDQRKDYCIKKDV